jgi:hypothetical protein
LRQEAEAAQTDGRGYRDRVGDLIDIPEKKKMVLEIGMVVCTRYDF